MQLQHNAADAWLSEVSASGGLLSIATLGAYRDAATDAAHGWHGSHGYGTCVDINTSSGNSWAISHFSSSTWVRDLWVPGNPQDAAHDYNHWHYVGPLTLTGEDMPTLTREHNTVAIPVTGTVDTGLWTMLRRNPTGSPSYDLTHTAGTGTWSLESDFYVSNLPLNEYLTIRLSFLFADGTPPSRYYELTIEGTASGLTTKQYVAKVAPTAGTSVVIEAQASSAGVSIDQWHTLILNWIG
jgi:hypothetical protein